MVIILCIIIYRSDDAFLFFSLAVQWLCNEHNSPGRLGINIFIPEDSLKSPSTLKWRIKRAFGISPVCAQLAQYHCPPSLQTCKS